ncbi:MAG: hypothetical protein ACK5SB_00350, partial [Flavobacterium sp.]
LDFDAFFKYVLTVFGQHFRLLFRYRRATRLLFGPSGASFGRAAVPTTTRPPLPVTFTTIRAAIP